MNLWRIVETPLKGSSSAFIKHEGSLCHSLSVSYQAASTLAHGGALSRAARRLAALRSAYHLHQRACWACLAWRLSAASLSLPLDSARLCLCHGLIMTCLQPLCRRGEEELPPRPRVHIYRSHPSWSLPAVYLPPDYYARLWPASNAPHCPQHWPPHCACGCHARGGAHRARLTPPSLWALDVTCLACLAAIAPGVTPPTGAELADTCLPRAACKICCLYAYAA